VWSRRELSVAGLVAVGRIALIHIALQITVRGVAMAGRTTAVAAAPTGSSAMGFRAGRRVGLWS
jgi:hypothetical protein